MRASESYALRFTSSNLKSLFFAKIALNSAPGLDKISSAKFEDLINENVDIVLRKTANCSYRFTNYRQKLISKGKDSKPREICIPSIRDKLTLCALSQVLDDVYGSDCITCQPQKLIDAVRRQLLEESFDSYVKLDIKGFYSSIDHSRLLRIIRRKIRKVEVVDLIREAIKTPSSTFHSRVSSTRNQGIPEGLSISNKLANIYASDIDEIFLNRDDCSYFRYVDDIFILCNASNLERIQQIAKEAIEKLDLELNLDKCNKGRIDLEEFGYLGYAFRPNNIITVRRSSILNIERALENLFRRFAKDSTEYWFWKLNLRITGCRIENEEGRFERYGWLYYFSRMNDIRLLYHLDWIVEKFFDKYSIDRSTEVKSFRRTFFEMSYNASATEYIPTFEFNMSLEAKKKMLAEVFSELDVDSLTEESVSRIFNKRIKWEAKRLEHDIGSLS